MKLANCCPDEGCGAFQTVLNMLRSHGVEPKIKLDRDGHFFQFKMPKDLTLYLKIAQGINRLVTCCATCYREPRELFEVKHNDCGKAFLICRSCMRSHASGSLINPCPYCQGPAEQQSDIAPALGSS